MALRGFLIAPASPAPLALKGPQRALTPGDDVPTLFAARCAQVFGAFVSLALDEPQTQPLKVARREFVEGQGVGCSGDSTSTGPLNR